MNWIFEAYANVYQTATGIGRGGNSYVATAKNSDCGCHDAKSHRR